MKLCSDCKYITGLYGPRKCARTAKVDATGNESKLSCYSERSYHIIFWKHCGPSGRFFETKENQPKGR